MKKITYLFLALTLVITSCSKDDDSAPQISGSISGTWNMISYNYTGTTITEFQGQSITSDFVAEAFDIDYSITFEENPNNLTTDGTFSLRLTTTALGQTQTQTLSNVDAVDTGATWELSNDEIITMANGETGILKIIELTENSLILSTNDVRDISQQGANINSSLDATLTFER